MILKLTTFNDACNAFENIRSKNLKIMETVSLTTCTENSCKKLRLIL